MHWCILQTNNNGVSRFPFRWWTPAVSTARRRRVGKTLLLWMRTQIMNKKRGKNIEKKKQKKRKKKEKIWKDAVVVDEKPDSDRSVVNE